MCLSFDTSPFYWGKSKVLLEQEPQNIIKVCPQQQSE